MHILVTADDRIHPVLDDARAVLAKVGVTRSTVQVEPIAHSDHVDEPGERSDG